MENDKWKMLFAHKGKSERFVTLLFIIFHDHMSFREIADFAEIMLLASLTRCMLLQSLLRRVSFSR